VCLLLSASLIASTPVARTPAVPLLYTVARQYNPAAWMTGAERFPSGATIFQKNGSVSHPLVADFFATADANVSFDGKAILFSGKQRSSDHWQIWEFSVSGNSPRQITQCDDDCVRPLYLPAVRFVYARKSAGQFRLESAALVPDGNKPLRLTYASTNFFPLDVLRDGRILFEASYPLGQGTLAELYTVYSDGSGVESYRCDHGYSRDSGKQLASGDIAFVQDGKLYRFNSAYAHEIPIHAPPGVYAGDVAEESSGAWLVSWRAPTQKKFELRRWNPGAPTLQPEIGNPDADVIQPALLAPRPVPNRHPSGLHDWTYANLLCLNAYTSKSQIAENSIASVRVYTRDASGRVLVLGTSQVEKDGSFYARVPGDRPLQMELLDRSSNILQKESGWFWLRGGEQRICVGCHAGPETAPENAVPAVLLRSIIPTDMTANSPGGGR
jgi:hypothetical protein